MADIDLRPMQKDRYSSSLENSVLESLLDSDKNACVSKQNKSFVGLAENNNATSSDPVPKNQFYLGELSEADETELLLVDRDKEEKCKIIPGQTERISPVKKRVDFVGVTSTNNTDVNAGKTDYYQRNTETSPAQEQPHHIQFFPRRNSTKLQGAHRIFDIIPVDSIESKVTNSPTHTDGPTPTATTSQGPAPGPLPTSQGTVPSLQQTMPPPASNTVPASAPMTCPTCPPVSTFATQILPSQVVTSPHIYVTSGNFSHVPSTLGTLLHPTPTSVIQTTNGTEARMVVSSATCPVLYATSASATPSGTVVYSPVPYMTLPAGGNIALFQSPSILSSTPNTPTHRASAPSSSQSVPSSVAQGTTFISHQHGPSGYHTLTAHPSGYHTLTALPNTYYTVSGRSASPHPRGIALTKTNAGIASSIPASLVPLVMPMQQGQGGAVGISRGLPRNVTLPAQMSSLGNVPEGHTMPAHYFTVSGTTGDQESMRSYNQMTVRSAGGISIDVGSTDGRNITVRGTLNSPEQLPYLPNIFRYTGDDGGKGDGDGRATWSNKAQFVLACVGYAVGLGNIWRFPYLCYKSGGGAFLIPYLIMLFLCGIPLLLMELAIGQYTRRGPIGAMAKICPLFKGAGVGTVMISFLLGTYYNVIIAWTIFYLFQSFNKEGLPWSDCNKTWAVNCFDSIGPNVTAPNNTKSPTQEYFDEVLLQKTTGIDVPGEIRLELVLALFLAWILVYFSLWKSIKSSGKVVYVTATLPYLLIGIFLWRALTLPGAYLGLQYFFKPKWELLLRAEVWVNAAAQNFNSIGIAFGSLIAFSSYNKYSNNIVMDTWAISLTNSFTSLLAGLIVFSTLGNIAQEQGKGIDEVVAQGPGLVFVVYPQALAKFPYANIWAALFFFMLLILGLDSQFATVEVIVTSLKDGFPDWIRKYLKRHEILVLMVCLVSFLLGLPNVTQGGIYFFQLIDYYAAAVSLMYLAFFEVIAVVWIYGANRLSHNIKEMTGRMPSAYFRYCWYFFAPILILAIWLFSMIDYAPPTYNKGEYHYPPWAIGLGWCIALLSIGPIPIFAVIAIIKAKGNTFWEKFRNSLRSQIDGCPCCGRPDNCHSEKHHEVESYPVKLTTYNTRPMNGVVKSLPQDSDTTANGTVISELSADSTQTDKDTNSDTQTNNTDSAAA